MDSLPVGGTCAGVDGGSDQRVSKLHGRLCVQQTAANCVKFGVLVTPEIQRCSSHKRSLPGGLCGRYEDERLCFRG